MVPACRTLDCVSVFALTVDDAWAALAAMAGPDAADPYSRAHAARRARRLPPGICASACRAGQPHVLRRPARPERPSTRRSRGSRGSARRSSRSIIEPFYETARLLYEGPWVAERYIAAIARCSRRQPEAMHPVTRADHRAAARGRARSTPSRRSTSSRSCARVRDARSGEHRRAGAADRAHRLHGRAGRWPIRSALNSRLGTYTNFVNLLDLCGARGAGVDARATACRSA